VTILHDLPDAGEADACAGEVADAIQSLEWLEQLACVSGVKANAVVSHVIADVAVSCRRRTELD
jgi:hypothetical protein